MRQIAIDQPKYIADIQAELANRRAPDMSDAEIMHQTGISMRVVYDKLPIAEQTNANKPINCATEVVEQLIGLPRARAVVEGIYRHQREQTAKREALLPTGIFIHKGKT